MRLEMPVDWTMQSSYIRKLCACDRSGLMVGGTLEQFITKKIYTCRVEMPSSICYLLNRSEEPRGPCWAYANIKLASTSLQSSLCSGAAHWVSMVTRNSSQWLDITQRYFTFVLNNLRLRLKFCESF